MNQFIEAARAIEFSRNNLANAIVERNYKLQPDLITRYGKSAYEKCIQDTLNQLSVLAEALRSVSPPLFYDCIVWTKILHIGLGISTQDFEIELGCVQEILVKHLPAAAAQIAYDYLEQALSYFPAISEKQASFIDEGNPLLELARNYLDALLKADQQSARNYIIVAVNQGATIKDIYLYVFQCVQREIGQLWQTNKISIVQEHYCSAATQLIMAQLYPQIISDNRNGRKIVVACVSGELHEIGARMVSDFFEMEGWDAYYVGANAPTSGILEVLAKNDSDILALSVTMTTHVSKVREMISFVRSSEQGQALKIIVGGYPFNLDPNLWRQVGADAFALDAQDAVNVANSLFRDPSTARETLHIATMRLSVAMSEPVIRREPFDPYSEEMMRLNNELVNAQRELSKKNIELLRIGQATSSFLAHISHEIRTPLSAILAFAEELLNQETPLSNLDLTDYAREIKGSGLQLLQLINNLLDLSRAEAGKMSLTLTEVKLDRIAHAVEQNLRALARQQKIAIRFTLEDAPQIIADEYLVRQVITNLLENALKYSAAGSSIHLKIHGAPPPEQGVILVIEDTGSGISASALPYIFEKFYRCIRSGEPIIGTGLGLSLVKQIVDLHLGQITVASVEGRGTTFSIFWPTYPALDPDLE